MIGSCLSSSVVVLRQVFQTTSPLKPAAVRFRTKFHVWHPWVEWLKVCALYKKWLISLVAYNGEN